ncbi:hypothetical protein C8R43DRAFT_906260, partial [Mycena crocata]
DATMKLWRPLAQRFLDEIMRHEGLGDAIDELACSSCKTAYSPASRRFRCKDCGTFVQCLSCCVSRHALTPLHRLEEWTTGGYWIATTLQALNFIYQLGHGGHPCPHPAPTIRTMVIMDESYIHSVDYRYCACNSDQPALNLEQLLRNGWYPATTVDPATCTTFSSLELFRLLCVIGNINVHDYVSTLERQTNAANAKSVPDRYKAYGLMSRQWNWLIRMKRAGCCHNPDGIYATKQGECAVGCWTCLLDGVNLPEGWRNVAPEFRFLYMLILAMDTNFRLKSRLRANQREDLPLGPGWGHLLNEGPYKEHLKDYVAEKDVSTCIAFVALLQKDTRMTTGLRCSGVVCARHELVRPLGIGDLQKGERYANMDYILLSAVIGITALYLAISYDIACQWKINLATRMVDMPDELKLDMKKVKVSYALPVWHAAAHERKCQVQNLLTYQVGVAWTDGEGIERTWSALNPLAWATKEMGPGARHDTIDEKVDHHNWEKNINQGTTLPRKLVLALDERDRQVAAFQDVDDPLPSDVRQKWQKVIDDWVRDPTMPNPYEVEDGKEGGPTEAAIKLALTQEEAKEAAAGGGKLHGSSVTSFLVAGLQLEDAQHRIRQEAKGRTLLPADQKQVVNEMRISFFIKLRKFRKLQEIYMPAAAHEVQAEEEARDSEMPPPEAEDIKLYLPSELGENVRDDGCRRGLPAMEAKLREGQCSDSIRNVRNRLHAKHHLLTYRDTNVVGQRAATRAYTLIERITERIEWSARKYKWARAALIALRGAGECTQWKELEARDIQLDEEREVDARARQRLGNVGTRYRRKGPALSSKKKYLSWIWTEGGGPGEEEGQIHDSVRVEWSKAKARKERWEEEVRLLREEMRRVLRTLRWHAEWWERKRGNRSDRISWELCAGLDAYASRQAVLHRAISRRLKKAWETSREQVVRMALEEDTLFAETWGEEPGLVPREGADEWAWVVEADADRGQSEDENTEDVEG